MAVRKHGEKVWSTLVADSDRMNKEGFESLVHQLRWELCSSSTPRVGIIGFTPTALMLLEALNAIQSVDLLSGIYESNMPAQTGAIPIRPMENLLHDRPTAIVVASDEHKERLLSEAAPFLAPETHILIAGLSHLGFSDAVFADEVGRAVVPSMANGYENSLIHIYQCLNNAARLGLEGAVAEFGMFKGGTTMLMSQFITRLGMDWKIYAFDTFDGFPRRRSPLDMYASASCVCRDEMMVRRMFEQRNVAIITGDIVQTVEQIRGIPIVLAFVDTDNFSPAHAIIEVIENQIVPGGAIVFDHFTGAGLYTLGERMAAKRLLQDCRYFNLHGTGVFLRQQ